MTTEQEDRLKNMTMLGRKVRFKEKGGPDHWEVGTVVDEVYVMVSDYKHLIQKIEFAEGVGWGGNTHGYRTGYYAYYSEMKHIKWGQYTQFLTESEYRQLLGQAKAKGWDIF